MPLQNDHILNPITALEFYQVPHGPLLILAGEGSVLKIFDAESSRLLSQCNVLGEQAIHGIKIRNVPHEGYVQAIVWGGSSLAILRKSEFEKLIAQDAVCIQQTPFETPDWILDTSFSIYETECIFLITAHNTLVKVRPGKMNTQVVFDMEASPSRSILYSAHLVIEPTGVVLVAAGTVFGEIIVWSCTSSTDVQVLHTFTGHEGSIFGVHISPLFHFQGGSERRLLASCSDDRTIRIWKLSTASERSGDRSLLATETGFGSKDGGQLQDESLSVATVMAHTSRIWRVRFVNIRECQANSDMTLLSFGEDSIAHQWSVYWNTDTSHSGTSSTKHTTAEEVTILEHKKTFASHSGKHIWSTALHHKDNSTLAILATGGADGKISLHDIDVLVHMSSQEDIELGSKPGSTSRAGPIISEKVVTDSAWDLEQDILKLFALPRNTTDEDNERLPSKSANMEVARINSVHGKASKKPKANKVAKDVFNKYGFVSEDQLFGTTTFGRLLLGKISKSMQWEEVPIPQAISQDIKSYSIVLGILEHGLAFFTGVSGKIYVYANSLNVVQVADVEGKVADMFEIYDPETRSLELLVTVLGSNVCTLFQIQLSSEISLQLIAKYQLLGKFVVTSAGKVDSLVVLGSRNGSLAIYDHNHKDTDGFYQATRVLPVPVEDAITTIIPLAEPSLESSTTSYFLTTRRDGMYSIFATARPESTGIDSSIRCIHVGGLPFGPMVESAWYDQGNLLLYGFKSTKFIVWDETQQLEVMNVDCGGAHRNYAYSPLKHSSGGHFAYTKASKLYIHSQLTPSHTILKRGGHGREIKVCAVSPDGEFFATGAEDTTIRIWSYNDRTSPFEHEFCHQAIVQKHSAGIQHLQWHNSNYLLSSGGNEEFFIWSISRIPGYGLGVVCEASCPDQTEEQDLRIMSFDVSDISENKILVSLAYSDSTIRVYTYSKSTGFNLIAKGRYTSACLTQIRHLHISSSEVYVLTAATDANISLWTLSIPSTSTPTPGFSYLELKFLTTQKIHQNTIKTLDFLKINESIIVVTGGDDNALALSIYDIKDLEKGDPTRYILRDAHAAAVTGLCILASSRLPPLPPLSHAGEVVSTSTSIPDIKIVSSSNDQRVKEWDVRILDVGGEGCTVGGIKMVSDAFTSIADVGDVAVLRHGGDGGKQKVLIVGNGMEVWNAS